MARCIGGVLQASSFRTVDELAVDRAFYGWLLRHTVGSWHGSVFKLVLQYFPSNTGVVTNPSVRWALGDFSSAAASFFPEIGRSDSAGCSARQNIGLWRLNARVFLQGRLQASR